MSNDSKFDHIDLDEKQKVWSECFEAEARLIEKKQYQDTLPKFIPPVLLSGDVNKKAESLDRFCMAIMMKPQPEEKPSTPQPTSSAPSGGESSQGTEIGQAATGKEAPQTASEPGETNKPESGPSLEARLEGLAKAMEDQAAHTSALEAKFDKLEVIQKSQFDLIMQQFAALESRVGFKDSTSCTHVEEATTLTIPSFDGSDAPAWLSRVDQYFLVHKTPTEKRVKLALIALSGPAMIWIQLLLRRNPGLTWDQFSHEFLIRFGPGLTLDGYEAMRTMSQEGSLDDYIAEFEGRLARLPELAENQYLGFFLGGLKPHIRMQIRDPITTYAAALQRAKHIDHVLQRSYNYDRQESKQQRAADLCFSLRPVNSVRPIVAPPDGIAYDEGLSHADASDQPEQQGNGVFYDREDEVVSTALQL